MPEEETEVVEETTETTEPNEMEEVVSKLQELLASIQDGAFATKQEVVEAIHALASSLEEETGLGGLGEDDGMELPEEEAVE